MKVNLRIFRRRLGGISTKSLHGSSMVILFQEQLIVHLISFPRTRRKEGVTTVNIHV